MKLTLPRRQCILILLLSLAGILISNAPFVYAQGVGTYGDTNVEPVATTLLKNYVNALTKFTVTQPITLVSVSMYLSYIGSDGSQCLKFGIYGDNGGSYGQSNPINQPLIAATKNAYCLSLGNFGPGWETWTLQPSDSINLNPGTYWIATLARQAYGTIYDFNYQGAYGGQYLYNYGYFNYAFPASYVLGFPPTTFGNTTYTNGEGNILPFNPSDIGTYNAPFSIYVTAVHPIPETSTPQLLTTAALLLPLLLIQRRRDCAE